MKPVGIDTIKITDIHLSIYHHLLGISGGIRLFCQGTGRSCPELWPHCRVITEKMPLAELKKGYSAEIQWTSCHTWPNFHWNVHKCTYQFIGSVYLMIMLCYHHFGDKTHQHLRPAKKIGVLSGCLVKILKSHFQRSTKNINTVGSFGHLGEIPSLFTSWGWQAVVWVAIISPDRNSMCSLCSQETTGRWNRETCQRIRNTPMNINMEPKMKGLVQMIF